MNKVIVREIAEIKCSYKSNSLKIIIFIPYGNSLFT